jgi:hypothetical protein
MKAEIICCSCLKLIDVETAFCQHCGQPIGVMITIDPVQAILTEGILYEKASTSPRKLIVVIGMLLLWGSFFALGLCLIAREVYLEHLTDYDFKQWVGFIGITLYLAFSGIISFKTLINFHTYRKRNEPSV